MMQIRAKRGFTLIELLVVIAIIGILATVILSALNQGRRKSRDARRLADLKEIKLALSNFFDENARYLTAFEFNADQLSSSSAPNCNGQPCMSVVPKDPIGNAIYPYFQCSPTLYHIGANLEESTHFVLRDDFDAIPLGCTDPLSTIDSDDADGCANEVDRYCYDTTP